MISDFPLIIPHENQDHIYSSSLSLFAIYLGYSLKKCATRYESYLLSKSSEVFSFLIQKWCKVKEGDGH